MSYQQDIFATIANFAGTNNSVAVPRVFCQMAGSLEGGTFLSQLIYWSDKGRTDGWFYKTYDEWREEIFLSEYQIRKLVKEFVELGFLETKLKKANGAPTIHYRIKKQEFSEWILKYFRNQESVISQNQKCEIQETITKTNTKSTTKTISTVDEEDIMPGVFLRTQLESNGFVYLDREFTKAAARIEADYTTEQIIRGVLAMREVHQRKCGNGERGITAPVAYLATMLAEEQKPPPPKPKTFMTVKEWCLMRYHTDVPTYALGIPEAEWRAEYEQAQRNAN